MKHPPAIFHVNWFRKDADGNFLWPGFGENVRVLMWILDRVRGRGKAVETPIGFVPAADGLEMDGLKLPPGTMEELLSIDPDAWSKEQQDQGKFFEQFGDRLPNEMREEHAKLAQRLSRVSVPLSPAKTPRAS
jgi:phosphoenolpyruvate carboxykinase (GTP)